MTKRKRYLLCGHGESLPMAEDGATSLSSVLEDLAVEVCAEAVSARRPEPGRPPIPCDPPSQDRRPSAGCRACRPQRD